MEYNDARKNREEYKNKMRLESEESSIKEEMENEINSIKNSSYPIMESIFEKIYYIKSLLYQIDAGMEQLIGDPDACQLEKDDTKKSDNALNTLYNELIEITYKAEYIEKGIRKII